jgi:tRNA(adenine34) deaminase
MMEDYWRVMERCEELAQMAETNGNSSVGSILMVGGKIIAEAEEASTSKEDVSCHAEMEVIRKARKVLGKDLRGAVLVSTKEPCVMCSYAIRFHRISTVVYKEKATFLGGDGSYHILTTRNVPGDWGAPVRVVKLSQKVKS